MKKIILSALAVASLSLSSYSQGVITFDASSSSGVVQINGATDNATDINAALLYFDGTSYVPFVTMLLSDTTPTSGNFTAPSTQAAGGDVSTFGAGILFDNAGNTYQLPSLPAGSVVSFEVQGWLGAFSTYAQAQAASGATWGTTAAFNETLSSAASPINASLDAMPNLNLITVPEPTTIALAGLGAASLLLFRRRKA